MRTTTNPDRQHGDLAKPRETEGVRVMRGIMIGTGISLAVWLGLAAAVALILAP